MLNSRDVRVFDCVILVVDNSYKAVGHNSAHLFFLRGLLPSAGDWGGGMTPKNPSRNRRLHEQIARTALRLCLFW
jgi:hypothetical protein